MQMKIFPTGAALAEAAAQDAAQVLRQLISNNGKVRLVAATGAAQFQFLELLTSAPDIDWGKVELFHLDEYLGISHSHPASFVRFLHERLVEKTGIKKTHMLTGTGDTEATIREVTEEIEKEPIDLAFIGIGENGHLAFNDPPADFETEKAFITVELDEACRKQQFGEGWFAAMDDVPRTAISMTVKQMLKSEKILAIVPEQRKAAAVAECFNGDISTMHPASVLRTHANTTIYLDAQSASLLQPETLATFAGENMKGGVASGR